MHRVERAIFDLRRGLPVLIRQDESEGGGPGEDHRDRHNSSTLVFPLESVANSDVLALIDRAGSQPALTVTRHRMAAMGMSISQEAASLPLAVGTIDSQALYQAASGIDSARDDLFGSPRPAHAAERAGLNLMRRALLIPAAITARVSHERQPDIDRAVAAGELLSVPADMAERCFELASGMLKRVSEADVPLADAAQTRFVLFREPDGLREHVAVVIGEPARWPEAVPVRLHSACLTGDLFGSLRCDCGEQLKNGIRRINDGGGGVLLYLAQEGRGIGLANKLRAYQLQDTGCDTVDADQALGFGEDERRYGVAVDMLSALAIRRVRLLTNNPGKIRALAEGGIEVTANDRLYGRVTEQNRRYLNAKAQRSGHLLDELLDG